MNFLRMTSISILRVLAHFAIADLVEIYLTPTHVNEGSFSHFWSVSRWLTLLVLVSFVGSMRWVPEVIKNRIEIPVRTERCSMRSITSRF